MKLACLGLTKKLSKNRNQKISGAKRLCRALLGNMATSLSEAFQKYVNNEDDVIGLLAYSLHKIDKDRWIKQWVVDNNTPPSAARRLRWSNEQSTPPHVQAKRRLAEDIIENLITEDREREYENMKEAAMRDCLAEISSRIPTDLDSRIPKSENLAQKALYSILGTVGGVGQNVLGTVVFIVLAGLFLVGKDFPSYLDFNRIRQLIRDEVVGNTKTESQINSSPTTGQDIR